MSLICFKREKGYKKELVLFAFHNRPSIIIDCANCANPHSLFPLIQQEWLSEVYVIEVELLYKFRQVLLQTKRLAKERNIQTIVITPFHGLFAYDNTKENNEVLKQAWYLIQELSKTYTVAVPAWKKEIAKTKAL